MNRNTVVTPDFWSPIASLIERKCNDFDNTWRKRKRIINTRFLVTFILKLAIVKTNKVTPVSSPSYGNITHFQHLNQFPFRLHLCVMQGKKCHPLFLLS